MANVDFARIGTGDPRMARPVGAGVTESSVTGHARSILDGGFDLEIEVQAPGWSESVAVSSPERPGAVRGAVEKVLRDLGLTSR